MLDISDASFGPKVLRHLLSKLGIEEDLSTTDNAPVSFLAHNVRRRRGVSGNSADPYPRLNICDYDIKHMVSSLSAYFQEEYAAMGSLFADFGLLPWETDGASW